MENNLQTLYRNRFEEKCKAKRNDMWIVLCGWFRKLIPANTYRIVDIAGGGVNSSIILWKMKI